MYHITNLGDKYLCYCQVQDGQEVWEESNLTDAIFSVIRNARSLNGDFITKDDIVIACCKIENCCQDTLLDQIKSGYKVVLDFDDKRIKYRITQEECDLILKIREGYLTVNESNNKNL